MDSQELMGSLVNRERQVNLDRREPWVLRVYQDQQETQGTLVLQVVLVQRVLADYPGR